MLDNVLTISHYSLPVIACLVAAMSIFALLRRRNPPLAKAKLREMVSGNVYPLRYRETAIGRGPKNDVVLAYPSVSRSHAVIVCSGKGWYIADVHSEAGVKVNGKKIEKRMFLHTGDRIAIGEAVLIFEYRA